jgi:hypothetical protein
MYVTAQHSTMVEQQVLLWQEQKKQSYGWGVHPVDYLLHATLAINHSPLNQKAPWGIQMSPYGRTTSSNLSTAAR